MKTKTTIKAGPNYTYWGFFISQEIWNNLACLAGGSDECYGDEPK